MHLTFPPLESGWGIDIIFPTGPADLAVTRENTWDNWSLRMALGYDLLSDLYMYATAIRPADSAVLN